MILNGALVDPALLHRPEEVVAQPLERLLQVRRDDLRALGGEPLLAAHGPADLPGRGEQSNRNSSLRLGLTVLLPSIGNLPRTRAGGFSDMHSTFRIPEAYDGKTQAQARAFILRSRRCSLRSRRTSAGSKSLTPSIWWKAGKCDASISSRRYTSPVHRNLARGTAVCRGKERERYQDYPIISDKCNHSRKALRTSYNSMRTTLYVQKSVKQFRTTQNSLPLGPSSRSTGSGLLLARAQELRLVRARVRAQELVRGRGLLAPARAADVVPPTCWMCPRVSRLCV